MQLLLEFELKDFLRQEYPYENARCEWKEFKNLKNSFSSHEKDDVVSYVAAIANMDGGFLVIGVEDQTLNIVGTDVSKLTFNGQVANTQSAVFKLIEQCTNLPSEGLSIREFRTKDTNKIVWIIQIPKHHPRRPVYAHRKAWQRIEDSLVEMTPERLNVILEEPIPTAKDWSAQLVPNATINDLDEFALAKARLMFIKVHGSRISSEEIKSWSDETFLSKSGVMVEGKLTRAAIILLGKPEATFKLRPAVIEISWSRRDKNQEVVDFEHFSSPFILTVDQVLARIDNLTLREMPGGTLFPDTKQQYDDYTMRETLHNCIAHQDYTLQSRIIIVENPGFLYYVNGGSFLPGTLENALTTQGPQIHFRNACLCRAMVNFNMIDTIGRGIRKMFNEQRSRLFPMPDYDIDVANRRVAVTLYGGVIDERYCAILESEKNLTLQDCIWLDAVQKGRTINKEIALKLRKRGLIEGRDPNYRISLRIAKKIHQLPAYTKNKGLDTEKMKQMILQYLKNAGQDGAKRADIYEYLKDVMPHDKTVKQQNRMLSDLLDTMKNKHITVKGRYWFEL